MQVSKDKLSLQYTGPGDHETDVGCIQANHAVPRNKRIYYYEVQIVNAGNKGLISIGFAEKGFNLGKHPGYDACSSREWSHWYSVWQIILGEMNLSI